MIKSLRFWTATACLAAASILPEAVLAAEIKSLAAKDGRITIAVTGEIAPGDTDVFKPAVKQANDAGKLVGNIRLNSNGGNLLEGVRLADAVRYGKMSTNVGKSAVCASACFLVFAAGSTKFASYGAQIGVHGASDQSGNETTGSNAATVSMAKIAKDLGVPPAIIGRMVVTPPSDMVWLTPQDLQSMGTTMVGKPDQVAIGPTDQAASTPQQTDPTIPLNIQPQTKAAKSAPSWSDLVDVASANSAAQNGGTPQYLRSCQPEIKVCHSVLIYFAGKKQMMLKVTSDINDKVLRREVCEFNPAKDVRKCVNWDSGEMHSDMQDSKGNWYQVSDD